MFDLSKLRICYLAGTLGQGGAERQLFYALQALRQSGVAVRLLALDRGAFWEKPISELGVPITHVGQDHSRLQRLFRIRRELKKSLPDIFQSQHFFTNVYASLAALFLKCVGIGALRSNGVFDQLASGQIGGQLNLHAPRVLAANSQSSIHYAIAHGVRASRLYFLPNVVDTERFKPVGEVPESGVTLLSVGRLTREKRFDRFLSILYELRKTHRLNVRGLIVGPTRPDQHLRQELEQQATALNLLPSGVQFLGSVADMGPIYRQASICVLTSDHEGTPNALLEAMASGLPVVATEVGGVPEIVRQGQTGFFFPCEAIREQTDAVLQLIRQPDLRTVMGGRGRAFVLERHSLGQLPIRLAELYRLAFDKKAFRDSDARGAELTAITLNASDWHR